MPTPFALCATAASATTAETPAGDHRQWEESVGGRALNAWLTERGFALSGCRVASVASGDTLHGGLARGLVATRDLPPGHVLFRVPRDAVLAPHNSAFGPAIHKAGLRGWNALIAAITYESVQDASPWKEYLDALPQELDSPLFWNDKELLLLQGTRVNERANARQVRGMACQRHHITSLFLCLLLFCCQGLVAPIDAHIHAAPLTVFNSPCLSNFPLHPISNCLHCLFCPTSRVRNRHATILRVADSTLTDCRGTVVRDLPEIWGNCARLLV
jgi:hypothetical protein